MLPDRVSNPGPLTHESGVLPIALRGPAPFLKKWKEKRKYVARPGIEPRTPDLRVRCPTDCSTRPGLAKLESTKKETPDEKGGKYENGKVASLESVSIPLKT